MSLNSISPRGTASAPASGLSVSVIGRAIVIMPSCTTPMFSKISVTRIATQPAMLMICHDSGSAIATVPTSTLPWTQSQIAMPPVPATSMALSVERQKLNSVLSRSEL